MSSTAQVTANQANSKQSTGPQSSAGKARSSHNALRHGLAAGVLIIAGEKPEEFEALLAELSEEFQPATPTEALLVKDMAVQSWLKTRAIRFQSRSFRNIDLDQKSVLPCDMDVLLRYHNAFHRAFHKSLQVLRDLQKERRKSEIGFVSQKPVEPVGQTIVVRGLSTPDPPKIPSPSPSPSQKASPE